MINNISDKVELLDMNEPEYRALRAVNWSSLKHMKTSPAQYRWEVDHPPKSTTAKELGTLIHAVLLEPTMTIDQIVLVDANRGTKKFEQLAQEYPHNILVTHTEYAMLAVQRERLMTNQRYAQIFGNATIEQPLRWTDPETNLVCKCRPDLYNDVVLVDIKTSSEIDERKWWWDFKKRRYHAQFAFYHDALKLLDGRDRVCVVIKIETKPCFDVVYYPLPAIAIEEGRSHYRDKLNELRDCVEANAWPGKCDELAEVNFHDWYIEDNN